MLTDEAIDKAVAGRSVLVTGGTGSFGRQFVDTLLKRRGHRASSC